MSETGEKDGEICSYAGGSIFFPFRGGNLGARSAYRVHLIGVGGVPDRCQVITRAMICQWREGGNEKLVCGTGSLAITRLKRPTFTPFKCH